MLICFEGLVAFHCAFLALRGQDASHPVGNIKDAELDGELQIYGGYAGQCNTVIHSVIYSNVPAAR